MVSSAETIISEVSVESVDLAKLIVVNYIKFPEWNVDVSEKSDTTDLVHDYAKELLSLSLFGMDFMMLSKRRMESVYFATGSFFLLFLKPQNNIIMARKQ